MSNWVGTPLLRSKWHHFLPPFCNETDKSRALDSTRGKGRTSTRWWFQIFFIFTPILGEMIQFDEHIFQMGWFNHQLVYFTYLNMGWIKQLEAVNCITVSLFRCFLMNGFFQRKGGGGGVDLNSEILGFGDFLLCNSGTGRSLLNHHLGDYFWNFFEASWREANPRISP